MNVQRINALLIKEVKSLYRVPATLFMAILFPIVLTGAFGLAFGGGSVIGNSTYNVGIVDLDNTVWSEYFIGNISVNEVFENKSYPDPETGEKDLAQGKISALIVIPDNFGASIESYWMNTTDSTTWTNVTIELSVDQGSLIASSAIPPLIQQLLFTTFYGESATNAPQLPVGIGNPAEVKSEHTTQFDLMAPGMFAFAAIFLTLIVAEGFTTQRTSGLLRRIQLTPTAPSEVVLSSVLANILTAVLQVGIVFVVAVFLGFKSQAELTGLIFSFLMVVLLALCSVGFGLIAASVAKDPGAATGLSFIFILPQMFFGTFMPGFSGIGPLVPSYYVTDALTSILLRGAAITSETVIYDLLVLIVYCIVVIIVGIGIFSKFGREK
ncbi:MAG: ABC transporter permease [Candidatus Hodarchaeales archaeon]|jgi:ABC-2 type transport system permease protein